MKDESLDNRILALLHVLVDYRISPTMEEPTRSMILHTFKKFRTKADIQKLLDKYEPYIRSQGY